MTSSAAITGLSNLLHLSLFVNTIAPLFVEYPFNLNVVVTASLAVFTGCVRSVKDAPPTEAMTKKDAMKFPLVGSVRDSFTRQPVTLRRDALRTPTSHPHVPIPIYR